MTTNRPRHAGSGIVPDLPLAIVVVLVLALAILVAACGEAPGTAATTAGPTAAPSVPAPTASEPPASAEPPEPTEVPGGASIAPPPLPGETTTTETDWGTILDAVPATFPVFPGAEPAESTDEPVSAAWSAAAGPDEVAGWYRDTLRDLLGSVELSDPLEDGSRVLDAVADIPECRMQLTFRPAGESTIITVLYGAGCAGGEG